MAGQTTTHGLWAYGSAMKLTQRERELFGAFLIGMDSSVSVIANRDSNEPTGMSASGMAILVFLFNKEYNIGIKAKDLKPALDLLEKTKLISKKKPRTRKGDDQ